MQRFWIAAGLIGVIFLHSMTAFAETAALAPAAPPTMGYGMMLARMVFMLAAVCALAIISLRWGLKRLTNVNSASQSIEVVSRAVIEPRRAVLVLRVGTRHLIVGTGEHGMTPLGELSEEEAEAMRAKVAELQDVRQQARPSFRKIFAATALADHSDKKPAFVLESPKNSENVQSL